jgi:uncharacterized zinc-type alcohol dehydrogenase-like protein
MKTRVYAAASAHAALAPSTIDRRAAGDRDVSIDVLFCGVCHSDIHQARDEGGGSRFPMVPGHEIIGRVSKIGKDVTRFMAGDLVGVGCMVDSCGDCPSCVAGHEQFCQRGTAFTYNSTEMDRRTPTYGGYSQQIVVTERFVVRVPDGLDPAAAAPLLCAGVTTYSPLRQWGCKPGVEVAVVGLGGLGHMAVKLAAAMGGHVTMLSTSAKKAEDAARLGAKDFALTSDPTTFKKLSERFDLIIDTVSAEHRYGDYLKMLRPFGAMVVVGVPPKPSVVEAFALIHGNRRLAGSSIGGMRETQEMLDFCAQHKIVSDIETIAAPAINQAYERTLRGDVRYRFVIDVSTLGS